jgi:glycosyltransferase involved in cell wall biosynthesis
MTDHARSGLAPTARPRVMHVLANLNLGGSEEVALALTEALSSECEFSVFAVLGVADSDVGRDMHARLRRLGVPLHCGTPLDMKRGGMLHGGWRLRQVLNRVRPDIVHLHTDIPDGAFAASRLFGRPPAGLRIVRTIHNTVLWPKWRRIGRWVERRLEDTEVVAVSPASLEGLHRFRAAQGLRRLSDEQCQVVYNGVAARGRRVGPRPAGPLRILFAGRFEPQKGVDLLPAILRRAAELSGAQAEVTLLGHGSLGETLARWATAPNLRWPVRLAPPLPQLSAHLGDYDVVLMPSRFEGLALLCIEALVAGVPVIASRIDGLRELFAPDYELLADPEHIEGFARLLARVADDPPRYRDQAQPLIAATEARFGLQRMADAYLGLYQTSVARMPEAQSGAQLSETQAPEPAGRSQAPA